MFWPHHTGAIRNKVLVVVEGNDGAPSEQLELILYRLGLNRIVLRKEAADEIFSQGPEHRHVWNCIYDHRRCWLLEGFRISKTSARAGQNVVLELGMLMSRLGRENIFMLLKGDLEVPSDAQGIFHIASNENEKEGARSGVAVLHKKREEEETY